MSQTMTIPRMDLPERLLVSRSEKHLRKYRDAAKHMRAEFLHQYYSYLPEIERCYERAGYWHGTGRYHHYHADDSRYQNVDMKRVVDVLESILEEGALTKHTDLWVKFHGQLKKTVSVAPSRMHARLYAHIHLREGVWLEYVFGGTRFWMGFFVLLASWQIFAKSSQEERRFAKWTILNRNLFKQVRAWGSAVCNLDRYKILPFWRAYDLRSDIAENYGILFGIKREAIQGDGMLPFIKRLEIRIEQEITLADMTHVEVPLENVEETKRMLVSKKIPLPVIPLEFGELYCSQFPLTKLARV